MPDAHLCPNPLEPHANQRVPYNSKINYFLKKSGQNVGDFMA